MISIKRLRNISIHIHCYFNEKRGRRIEEYLKENVFLLCRSIHLKNRSTMKITIVAGARPNFMKIAPIMRAATKAKANGKNLSCRLIYTGKKEDKSIEPSLFVDLDMPMPDAYLGVDSDNLSLLAGSVMFAFERELQENPTQLVLVVDDLTSTMACTIVAKKRGIKVAHVIAGTRSFRMDMPKEVNRMIIDGLSDYLFIAGMVANRNLNLTGAENEHVFFVGNILIDTLRYNRNRLRRPAAFDILGLKEKEYMLLTINRHAILANELNFKALLETLIEESKGRPIVAPLHNYVREKIAALHISVPNLHILPPQGYLSFGYLINNASSIVTDSGNVAEEATFLSVPCITLNTYAEHPETISIGTNELVGEDPKALASALRAIHAGTWKSGSMPERWDGRAAERIIQILTGQ